MKRMIKGTSGKSTSVEYIKNQLFDLLADDPGLNIDGVDLAEAVDRIHALRPIFDVDDVLEHMESEGVTFSQALYDLEDDAENM